MSQYGDLTQFSSIYSIDSNSSEFTPESSTSINDDWKTSSVETRPKIIVSTESVIADFSDSSQVDIADVSKEWFPSPLKIRANVDSYLFALPSVNAEKEKISVNSEYVALGKCADLFIVDLNGTYKYVLSSDFDILDASPSETSQISILEESTTSNPIVLESNVSIIDTLTTVSDLPPQPIISSFESKPNGGINIPSEITSTHKYFDLTFIDMNITARAVNAFTASSGPGTINSATKYENVFSVSSGSYVNVIGLSYTGWARIELDGQIGYVYNSNLCHIK